MCCTCSGERAPLVLGVNAQIAYSPEAVSPTAITVPRTATTAARRRVAASSKCGKKAAAAAAAAAARPYAAIVRLVVGTPPPAVLTGVKGTNEINHKALARVGVPHAASLRGTCSPKHADRPSSAPCTRRGGRGVVRASELAVFARAEGADQVDLERGATCRGHLRIWAPARENGLAFTFTARGHLRVEQARALLMHF